MGESKQTSWWTLDIPELAKFQTRAFPISLILLAVAASLVYITMRYMDGILRLIWGQQSGDYWGAISGISAGLPLYLMIATAITFVIGSLLLILAIITRFFAQGEVGAFVLLGGLCPLVAVWTLTLLGPAVASLSDEFDHIDTLRTPDHVYHLAEYSIEIVQQFGPRRSHAYLLFECNKEDTVCHQVTNGSRVPYAADQTQNVWLGFEAESEVVIVCQGDKLIYRYPSDPMFPDLGNAPQRTALERTCQAGSR